MSGKGGNKLNEISILAFNINGLKSRIENDFNLKIEEGEENKEIEKPQKTQEEKYVDIFLLFETFFVTDEGKDEDFTKWLKETEETYELHRIPAIPSARKASQGCLFGYKRNTTKNFEYKFIEQANHWVIKISKKDKNTMPTFIIPVYINFTPSWEEKFEELKVTMSCLKGQNVLLIGDFNAHIGSEQILNDEAKGNKHLFTNRNAQNKTSKDNNGPKLIKWCNDIGVTLLNGRTKSDKDGKLTRGKSTIDFCFVQGNLHQCATDFEVRPINWGSDHHPIVAKAQLSFPKGTHILFTDLLAASTRPFEAKETAEKITESEEDKEKAEKSKELVKKFMDQMVCKKYIENLSKMFAKLKDRQALHELVEENWYFFGQNIEIETTIFVQNIEKLLREVIRKKLPVFQVPFKEYSEVNTDILTLYKFEHIAKNFLKSKQKVLFAVVIHYNELLKLVKNEDLTFKWVACGMFSKQRTEIFKATIKPGHDFIHFESCHVQETLYQRMLMALLKDYLPGGINYRNKTVKLVFYNDDHCVVLAETSTMIQRMVKEFKQYFDCWDITVDLKTFELKVYDDTGKRPYYPRLIYGDQKISRFMHSNHYESCIRCNFQAKTEQQS